MFIETGADKMSCTSVYYKNISCEGRKEVVCIDNDEAACTDNDEAAYTDKRQ